MIMQHENDPTASPPWEDVYRVIVENANDAICLVEPDTGRIRFPNAAFSEMFGYTIDELEKMTVLDLHLPQNREWARGILSRVALGERVAEEFWTAKKDGEQLCVEIRPAMVELGGTRFAVSVTRDITERKRAQEALKASEEKYRDLVENAFDIILSVDADGNVTEVNKKMADVLGYSQQELCRMNHRDFAAPEYHDTITAHLKKTIEQGAREGYECEWIARDGHRIPLEINSTARYSESGTFQVTRCIVRDISARQVLERRLVESERLRAIGEVAAGVAHNFNNLLTAILFRVRSIENASHDAASVARDAKAIEVASQDASAMIQRLQVSSGRPASDVSRVDVDRLVLEVIDTTRPQWDDIPLREGRNIEVKTDLESGQSILGDPTELREVFTNLILNGVDALPEGGEITIKTAPQVAHVVLSVSDTGVGIPDEHR